MAWSAADDPAPLAATYAAGPEPEPDCPALPDGDARADVVIVGAGFTGLSAALTLAEAGVQVRVLEARQVGWGGSGRAFGQVVPYSKLSEAALLRLVGPDWGERMLRGLADGPATVAQLVQRHGIRCELDRGGLLFAAHAERARPGLERRARFWQDRGAPVEMVEGSELEMLSGTRTYRSALLDRRGLTLNPLAYARGLARAVLEAGGSVHGGTLVTNLRREGQRWHVATSRGTVTAEQVVLATDAYSTSLWPSLARSVVPLRGYQLVSRPLPDAVRRSVLPGGQALTDTRRMHSGIRLRPDGRLHVSTGGPMFDPNGVPDAHGATRRLRKLFPELPDVVWEDQVTGWVGMTRDHLPHVHPLAPGLLAATGLNGRGIAIGTLLGREAAARVLQTPEDAWMMPSVKLPALPPRPILRPALTTLIAAYRALDALELRVGR